MLENQAQRWRVKDEAVALWCSWLLLAVASCGAGTSEKRIIPVEPSEAGSHAGGSGNSSEGDNEAGNGAAPSETSAGAGGEGGVAEAGPCEKTSDNSGGDLELVSLSRTCAASDGDAVFSRLTPDGRFVAFDSDAGDLVVPDANGTSDVFLFNLETRELELISKHYEQARPVEGHSWLPVPSDDARYVAFTSYSYELISSEVPDGIWVYLRDRQAGTVKRFPASYACTYWLDMSDDARFILAEGFSNCQSKLEDGAYDSTVEYDSSAGRTRRLGKDDGSDNYRPAVSSTGRFVLWGSRPAGTRGQYTSRLELFDREANTSQTLPVYGYHYGSTAVSDDGKLVAYSQNGQVYRLEVETSNVTLVSENDSDEPGEIHSYDLSMSADGRFIAFVSSGTNLVDDDTNDADDVFLYDAELDSLKRISVAPDGTQADGDSGHPDISSDGARVSFVSKARNLLPAANTGNWQLYVLTLAR
jgi:Tol biopolymer transport system component